MSSDPRLITIDDVPAVGKLLNDVFRRGKNIADQDVLTDFPLVFAPANLTNCRVIEVEDQIVSHAAVWPCELVVDDVRLKLGVIVLVATHPDYRYGGLAAQLMLDLQNTMHEDGYDLGILWTGVPEFYRKLGWQIVTPKGWLVDDLRLTQDHVAPLAQDIGAESVVPYDVQQHLEAIIRLHDAEVIRVARSQSEYATLLRLPKMHVWVLIRNGEVAAYLVVGQAVNKRGMIEYGGSANDIVAIASHLLQSQRIVGELPFPIFHTREELVDLIAAENDSLPPLECSKGRGCEMIYIVQPDRVPQLAVDRLFIWGLDFT